MESFVKPRWVTKKVSEIAAAAGGAMTVRSLRHYSASQLVAGGIDLRNTAARLGHGGGGATTLRHYADPLLATATLNPLRQVRKTADVG